MCSDKRIHQLVVLAAVASLILSVSAFGADQYASVVTELPQPAISKPQYYCGYCHLLTYPAIFNKGYELWKKSKHIKASCVDCHYPPQYDEQVQQAHQMNGAAKDKHIPKNISAEMQDRFSYLPIGGESIQTRSTIVDASCLTADCHGKPEDDFMTKGIEMGEKKIKFVHKPHFDEKKQIEGMKMGCTSCHQHLTEDKHFEVSKASCTLCHFKNAEYNQGRGKCELCHALPTKPIQETGGKRVTHAMLKREKVSCAGCHLDLLKAVGGASYREYFENRTLNIALIMGAGGVKENCQQCHLQEKDLKEKDNKKLMHAEHVAKPTARCFDCHRGWRGWKPGYLHVGLLQSGLAKK
jgi:nitrate/TMAO reductase-like tetraheme cytochrome c subunit